MPLRKSSDSRPQISQVTPPAAIAGGELQIRGKGFAKSERPRVTIGEVGAPIIIGSDSFVIARVPEGATAGELVIESGGGSSDSWACDVGVLIAESLHPVTSPAIDSFGNIYTTFSGSRGQKVPVAVYRIDLNFNMKPFINDLMNATAMAFDRQGMLYISSRYDGFVYQVTPNGNLSVFVEGMGVATGLAFDGIGNLYVGDRSGTIFKISPTSQIFVFATLEPSISA
jgi:sugar lactone lactonase YvrE